MANELITIALIAACSIVVYGVYLFIHLDGGNIS